MVNAKPGPSEKNPSVPSESGPKPAPELKPILVDIRGEGLSCDPETGVCTIPGTNRGPTEGDHHGH